MESEGENNTRISSYATTTTKTTSWIISGGSIENSVTFESSIDEDDVSHDDRGSSPLILRSPSPDSTPCEITIAVNQKHELRQVYVRSTARVYEIYYASHLQSSNEYLCTVRCGIATRDEDVLSVPEIEVADVASSKHPTEKANETNLKTESSSSTNEDDWVEVKIPGNSHGQGTKKTLHDFYEATAEISDTDPCTSLTIRLLSLQSKDFVCIDEIYVFADPVDPMETKSYASENTPQNLAGSSLMAMLMPTFLQISKAQGNKQTLDRTKEDRFNEIEQISNEAAIVSEIQQDSNSYSVNQQEAESHQPEIPQNNSKSEIKSDLTSDHIEKVLEQLVSRVSRIEDVMLRFEERLLKPINSIDERLQRVEQQIEGLNHKLQNSGVPPGVRISAPDFSCCDSTENSFYHDGANVEKDGQEFSPLVPSDNSADVATVTQSTPGLRVMAPEFSNEDEEIHELEPVLDSPKDKPRRVYSIDDALASALTGFLSSALENQKYSQALSVKAPDFSNEDSDNKDITDLTEREECMKTCLMNTEDREIPDNINFEANINWRHNLIGGENDSLGKKIESLDSPTTHELGLNDDVADLESSNNENENSEHETVIQVGDSFDGSEGKVVEIVRKHEAEEKSILDDFLRFSSFSSQAVNFEIPILDVKFTSEEYSETKSPFEALLGDMPESNIEKSDLVENVNGLATHEQDSLISLVDNDITGSVTSAGFTLDVNYCSVLPIDSENLSLQENHVNQETAGVSLI